MSRRGRRVRSSILGAAAKVGHDASRAVAGGRALGVALGPGVAGVRGRRARGERFPEELHRPRCGSRAASLA